MKKILSLLTILMAIVFTAAADKCVRAEMASADIAVVIDGQAITFDVPPFIIDDRVMVPFRQIGEALGAAVTWDEPEKKATMVFDDIFVELTIGNPTMTYGSANDRSSALSSELDEPPFIVDGRTLVPLRAVSEGLGAGVEYTYGTVYITPPPVKVKSVNIALNRSSYTVGQEDTVKVSVLPEDAADKRVALMSDYPDVLSISDNGSFICHAEGKASITAMASNGVSGSQKINVFDLDAFAAEVLRLTNLEREKKGMGRLSGDNAELNETAKLRARELVTLYSHTRPDGSSWHTAFDEAGVKYRAAAENIASGFVSPEAVVKGWMDSEGHRKNILNDKLSYLGVGVEMTNEGRVVWAQSFCG